MRGEKRDKFQIYFEILTVLSYAKSHGNEPCSTRVARRVNMAYDRFQRYLNKLVEVGMVMSGKSLVLTRKGEEYIDEYRRFEGFLRRVGLVKR